MVNFAYALPYVPPAPPAPPWQGFRLSWRGWDGSEWELSKPSTGLFLRPGVRGLHLPEFERQSTESAMVAGSRHRGTSTKNRECFWPIYLYSDDSSAAFLERDRAFWNSLDPDLGGTWTIHLPGGKTRSLNLRLTGSDDDLLYDSIKMGWAKYGVTLLADQPYWLGDKVRRSWSQGEQRNYYVTAEDRVTYGYAPDVIHYLSSGGNLGSATFSNDGDVPAYPVWTVVGPVSAVSFGVEGSNIVVPFTIPSGYAAQIDTDPINGQVLWYGEWDGARIVNPVDRTADLDPSSKFVAIPRGQNRPLSFTMTGTGTVIADVQNRYRRAW